jgi:hypothetical protein
LWIVHLFTAEETPTWSLALLAATPAVSWLARRPFASRPAVLLRGMASLLPVAGAVGLVAFNSIANQDEASGYAAPLPSASRASEVPGADRGPVLPTTTPADDDTNPFRRWADSPSQK